MPVMVKISDNSEPRHPMQPIVVDQDKRYRFKQNRIIRWLVDAGRVKLTELVIMPFSEEDLTQFLQQLGYTIDGLSEIDSVPDEVIDAALVVANDISKTVALMATGKIDVAPLPFQETKRAVARLDDDREQREQDRLYYRSIVIMCMQALDRVWLEGANEAERSRHMRTQEGSAASQVLEKMLDHEPPPRPPRSAS